MTLTELNFGTVVNQVLAEVAKQVTLRLEQQGRLEGLDGPARAALTRLHRARLADLVERLRQPRRWRLRVSV
jgi:hypothetical protein